MVVLDGRKLIVRLDQAVELENRGDIIDELVTETSIITIITYYNI